LVSSDHRLSQREIAFFFFPLLLNVQLMSLSHSLINAALARLAQPVLTLAGFSIAIVLHLCLASPAYQNHTIAIALIHGRRSLFGVGLYVVAVALYVSVLLALVAYTPLGKLVFEQLIGVSPAISDEARSVLAILTFLPFFTGLRGLCQGIVIRARRTGLVSLATLIRILSLVGFLLLGRHWFSGAAIGAFGLLACIVVETIFMVWFAWKTYTPCATEVEKSLGAIFRYALPLSFSSAMQQTVPLMISAIISRLPDSAPALAAFGVIRGFIFLLSGPMRNLQQAYLTLIKGRDDYRTLVIFFQRVAIGMGLITLAIAYPLNQMVLGKAMGLSVELRQYIALPLAICALYPAVSGIIYIYRGAYLAKHRTAFLSWATLCKVAYLCICWLLLMFQSLTVPGIALAIFLLLSCELCEAWYLRSHLKLLA
jgi:hypothetical protein